MRCDFFSEIKTIAFGFFYRIKWICIIKWIKWICIICNIIYLISFKFKFDKINEISKYLLDTYVYVKL